MLQREIRNQIFYQSQQKELYRSLNNSIIDQVYEEMSSVLIHSTKSIHRQKSSSKGTSQFQSQLFT